MPESAIATLAPVAGLDVSLSDGVLSVTIDRPDSLNSLTTPVITGLADTMERAATDPRDQGGPPRRRGAWLLLRSGHQRRRHVRQRRGFTGRHHRSRSTG